MAAGHNSGLQPPALLADGLWLRRQPWLRFHCTAAAGRGIMMGVAALAFAAAAETKRYAVPYFSMVGVDCHGLVFLDDGNLKRCGVGCSQWGPFRYFARFRTAT